MHRAKAGSWYAVAAYAWWGLVPLYWKPLHAIAALQLIGHRVFWSCAILAALVLARGQWRAFRAVALVPRVIGLYAIAALLAGINWLTYVWAVNANFIVETSLGYFITPLVSVLLGVFVLHERLRFAQWAAVALAAAGVAYLTLAYGALPWIALTLAASFGLYGLVKKIAPLGAVFGLALETAILLPVALAYLVYVEQIGQGAFGHMDRPTDLLLAGTGLVTTVPLLLFAAAAQRVPLALVGLFQYIAPTLQLALGVLVYHETFGHAQGIGFGAVWLALGVFVLEGWWAGRAQRRALARPASAPAAGLPRPPV